jgi:sterol desaturase/sphingolipid hydroxylase (fatty acid hydroxylase superfamily)
MHTHRLLTLYPYFVAAILVEIAWYLLIRKRAYPWKEMLTSTVIFVLRLPTRLLLAPLVVAPVSYFVWSHRLFTVELNTARGIAALFLATEFAYYWSHRAGHEVRWMWASHVVHHTPEQIHFASAYRLGPTEVLSGGWLFHLPLFALGFHPLAVGGMLAVNLFYQFWLHTDLIGRLGPLEWLLNTPSHHRVHHASNTEYLDRNYGGILIIWDRLFGTFTPEHPQTPITYGLVHPIGSHNPIKVALHEWGAMARDVRRARSWREKLRQLFGRPADSLANTLDWGKPALESVPSP